MERNHFNLAKGLYILNLIDALGILILLSIAFTLQFLFHELPCPLCLLQRAGFLIICLGLLMNLRFGIKPAHYSVALLGAVLTLVVALRQVALHVIPGTGGYGSTLFGMHLYTWSFVGALAFIIAISITQAFSAQYQDKIQESKSIKYLSHLIFIAIFVLTILNSSSIYFECGLKECPENPTSYPARLR